MQLHQAMSLNNRLEDWIAPCASIFSSVLLPIHTDIGAFSRMMQFVQTVCVEKRFGGVTGIQVYLVVASNGCGKTQLALQDIQRHLLCKDGCLGGLC